MEASTTEECRLSKEGLPESLCSLRNKLYCKAKLEINDKLKEKASGEPSTGNLYPRFDEGRCPLRAPATLLVRLPRTCCERVYRMFMYFHDDRSAEEVAEHFPLMS